MAKHGENIYLRKDGRYEGRYIIGKKDNGKTAFGYIYDKKYSVVKRRLSIVKGEYAKGEKTPVILFRDGAVSSWLRYWLEFYASPYIKQSTLENYRRILDNHVIPFIGDKKLREVDKETLANLYEEIQRKGGSVGTAQNACKRLRCALLIAQEENLIGTVPGLPFRKPPAPVKAPRCLTEREQSQLEKQLSFANPKDIAIFLGLYTGARIGECCALKWEDINFKEHEISISHTCQRISINDGSTKTALLYTPPKTDNAVRIIPMTITLEKALLHMYKERKPRPSCFVFGTEHDPLDPRVLQYHMVRLKNRAQIKEIHFHTLRHTFATRCLEMQIDVKTLSELLGHSSAKITLDWYCHSSRSRKKKLIQKIDTSTLNI